MVESEKPITEMSVEAYLNWQPPPGIFYVYDVEYTQEILDIRNWLVAHQKQVFNAINAIDFDDIGDLSGFTEDVYDVMKKSMYFSTKERAWMADVNYRSLVERLIFFACDGFRGGYAK
jgi:hypothetical protein